MPGCRPRLTPNSVTGTFLKGTPVASEMVKRLSSGCCTMALRPNGIGCCLSLRPNRASYGVRGVDDLLVEWLRHSPTDWSSRRSISGGR